MNQEQHDQAVYWLHQQLQGAIALIVLTVLIVSLKLLGSRLQSSYTTALLWNDALIVAALIAFLTVCACAIVSAQAYLKFYSTESKITQQELYIAIYKATYGFSAAYPVACVLPKLSVCLLYLRLFGIYRWVRIITRGTIVLPVANSIAWLVPSVIVCDPISQYWSPRGHQARCIDYNTFGTWISLPHILSDLVILSLPVPILWKTQMKVARKIGLILTFLAGSMINALDVIVSYVEPGMYLIAACLPSLRAVFIRLQSTLRTGLSSLFQKRKNTSDTSESPRSSNVNMNRQQVTPNIDVKLTGVGILDTPVTHGEEGSPQADDCSNLFQYRTSSNRPSI